MCRVGPLARAPRAEVCHARNVTLVLAAAILVGAGAAAQMSRSPGDDTARRIAASTQRYEQTREEAIAEALRALERGDAVDSAIALHTVVERFGSHPAIRDALETLRPHAAEAAEARVERLLREGKAREAVSLLAKVGAATHSQRLDELLDRATLDRARSKPRSSRRRASASAPWKPSRRRSRWRRAI